jgi:two-component system response regulator YesN
MYKMLLIDDEYLVRMGIKQTIDWAKYNIEIVAELENGQEGVEYLKDNSVDIILLDMKMPIMDGVEFVKATYDENYSHNIIVLSGHSDFNYAKESFEKGVFTYLLKPVENDIIIEAVLAAIEDLKKKKIRKNAVEIIKTDILYLQEKTLNDILSGKIKYAETYDKKNEVYELYLPLKGYISFVKIIKNSYENAKEIIEEICEKTFLNNEKIESIHNCESGLLLFHNDEIPKEKIEENFRKLIELLNNYDLLQVSIGISNEYKSYTHMKFAYDEIINITNNNGHYPINVVNSKDTTKKMKPQVEEVLKYISEHYMEKISIKSASMSVFISESNLMHSFKEELKITFNDYLTNYRLEKAKVLLMQGNIRVSDVATRVGYINVKYFSQVFKKIMKMTPSEYAEKK